MLFPVSPGSRYLDPRGRAIVINADEIGLLPNLTFRQVSPDYDAVAHTTAGGYRAPAVDGMPDTIFLGDSFTFGLGLNDAQTFAALYCSKMALRCVNLGQPGTGTRLQRELLEHVLATEGWRPKEVKLFMLVMTTGLAAGNDLFDTLFEEQTLGTEPETLVAPSSAAVSVAWFRQAQRLTLTYSNLARVAYGVVGPYLRAVLSDAPDGGQLASALAVTGEELRRLQELSRRYGFALSIYLLHPIQDLLRDTYSATAVAVEGIAGGAAVVDLAPALLDRATQYYFPYDGHLNPAGAAKVADALVGARGDPR